MSEWKKILRQNFFFSSTINLIGIGRIHGNGTNDDNNKNWGCFSSFFFFIFIIRIPPKMVDQHTVLWKPKKREPIKNEQCCLLSDAIENIDRIKFSQYGFCRSKKFCDSLSLCFMWCRNHRSVSFKRIYIKHIQTHTQFENENDSSFSNAIAI